MKHLIPLFLALSIHSIILQAQNLLTNGGFEENTSLTDSICLWITSGRDTLADFSLSTDDPAEGNYCAQIEVTQVGINYWDIEMRNFTLNAEEGVSYRISLKAKANVAGRHINFLVTKATTPFTYYSDNRDIALTTEWATYSYVFTSPVSTPNDISTTIHFTEPATYWLDDVRVEKYPVISCSVNANGSAMRIVFAQDMQNPALEQITFFAHVAPDNIIPVTEVAQDMQDQNVYNLTLADTIYRDQIVRMEYIPGTITTRTGMEISAFFVDAVNNSRQNLITSLEPANDIQYLLYPNPARDYLTLDGNNSSGIKLISILDYTGKTLFSEQCNGEPFVQINVHSLQPGIYILKAISLDDKSMYYKFIRE